LPWRRKDVSTGDNPTSWFVDWIRGGEPTLSGISVTPESAMRMAAVWACIRVRSEDVGKTPCILYRRRNAAKDRATDHPLYGLIHDSPNPRMTAFEFKQMMQAQIDLRGNAYALKEFTPRTGYCGSVADQPDESHGASDPGRARPLLQNQSSRV
jgi:phage portal protein BeeE